MSHSRTISQYVTRNDVIFFFNIAITMASAQVVNAGVAMLETHFVAHVSNDPWKVGISNDIDSREPNGKRYNHDLKRWRSRYLFGDKYLFSILPNQQRARSDFCLISYVVNYGKVHHAEVKEILQEDDIALNIQMTPDK
jgi:hypothetical protein